MHGFQNARSPPQRAVTCARRKHHANASLWQRKKVTAARHRETNSDKHTNMNTYRRKRVCSGAKAKVAAERQFANFKA
eukprot:11220579-Lingulodinium_polyedra.AAC.1